MGNRNPFPASYLMLWFGSPGRFYAASVSKLALAHVLLNYTVKMKEGIMGTKRNFYWRSAIIPKSSVPLLFRRNL